jgi:hypothetical protein
LCWDRSVNITYGDNTAKWITSEQMPVRPELPADEPADANGN